MTLARWASRSKPARSPAEARALLESMPGGPNIAVPMRYVSRAAYEGTISNAELNARIEAAPIRDVPIDRITAIQHTVRKGRVAQYIDRPTLRRAGTRDPRHGGLVDLPIVVRKAGTLHLHDGHHRATAGKLRGEATLRVRYVDLDGG